MNTVFPCIKVVPKQEETVAIGSSKMGGFLTCHLHLNIQRIKEMLQFIAQFNLKDLQNVGMVHDLPKTGMLYFFSVENYFEEV